ncbi:dienelactone hydrolase family protein [Romeriopsis navalis]|uniref:dienelactone hydrolase family protein n=1 Tax=Romeriopsis navalis TaxID=2992132 RepID=UPI0021F85165|nr:dienelactone hydrolase family protein [Romeriopsis navalis]
MTQPLQTESIQIPNGALQIAAYQSAPQAPGNYPCIIVIQEVFGVNAYIRDVCDRIASWGFIAVAPAIFQRTAPGFEVGYRPEDLAAGRSHKDQTKAPELISDIQATIAYLKQQPQANARQLGIIGFCFGGHVAYLGATLPEIKVSALFYPSGIAVMTPGGGEPSLTLANKIQGTIYGFFGLQDPIIPNSQTDQIETTFQQQGIKHQIFRYPADHGFACDRRPAYNAEAATDAWKHTQELFDTLKHNS